MYATLIFFLLFFYIINFLPTSRYLITCTAMRFAGYKIAANGNSFVQMTHPENAGEVIAQLTALYTITCSRDNIVPVGIFKHWEPEQMPGTLGLLRLRPTNDASFAFPLEESILRVAVRLFCLPCVTLTLCGSQQPFFTSSPIIPAAHRS